MNFQAGKLPAGVELWENEADLGPDPIQHRAFADDLLLIPQPHCFFQVWWTF